MSNRRLDDVFKMFPDEVIFNRHLVDIAMCYLWLGSRLSNKYENYRTL